MSQLSENKAVSAIIDIMRNDPNAGPSLNFALAVCDLVTPSPSLAHTALTVLQDQLAKAHGLTVPQLKELAAEAALLRPPQESDAATALLENAA